MSGPDQNDPRQNAAAPAAARQRPIRRDTVQRRSGEGDAAPSSSAKRGGKPGTMTPAELRAAIAALAGNNQCRFARVCGVYDRTVRRWLAGDEPIPKTVQVLVRALAALPEPERNALVRDAGAIE